MAPIRSVTTQLGTITVVKNNNFFSTW